MVLRVLEYAGVKEEKDDYKSALDMMFDAMERNRPESVAVRQYKVFN